MTVPIPSYVNAKNVGQFIKNALKEDIGSGDHTSLGSVPDKATKKAALIVKDEGLLAGANMANYIFKALSETLKVSFYKKDGQIIKNNDKVFIVEGNARQILMAERLVLNCMQRMSGIATYTSKINSLIASTGVKILDTRKTTPNFRLAEKWAVAIGGGHNHRYGLYDMVLLKDNHIDYAGGVPQALTAVKEYLRREGLDLDVEIEVRNLSELDEVLSIGGVKRILLDNMLPSDLRQAVALVGRKYETEASGGITEKNIREIAETGVDYISVGALTHSYRSLDMSLKAY